MWGGGTPQEKLPNIKRWGAASERECLDSAGILESYSLPIIPTIPHMPIYADAHGTQVIHISYDFYKGNGIQIKSISQIVYIEVASGLV